MKSYKSYLLAAIAATIIPLLASCLSNDDDNNDNNTYRTLTPAEKSQTLFNIAGDYQGKAYFINNEEKNDSLDIQYTITAQDSVLAISDFDMKMLEQYSKIASGEYSRIVANAGKTELRVVLHPYYNPSFANGYYTLTHTCDQPITVKYNDGEKDHTIILTLGQVLDSYYVRYYSVAEYYQKRMQGNIIIKSLDVNGYKFDVNALIGFSGKQL